MVDSQNEMKRIQNEALQVHQKLDDQIAQLKREKEDSTDKIQRLLARKEELKDVVADLEGKLDELKSQNDAISSRWQDRTSLLDKLEKQVEQMRRGWEEEQQLLITERDDAKNRAVSLQAQMERMDAAFRKQMAATIEANDRAISAARLDAEMIRSSCESRVAEVEAEMRVVLVETEEARQAMESRLRKLSSVLCDPLSAEPSLPAERSTHHSHHHSHTCPHGTEWSATPPSPSLPPHSASIGLTASTRLGSSRLNSPPPLGHTCARMVHPLNSCERDMGSGCDAGIHRSPH
ncbi:unnamed protein product [Echinostoma caproni]|uniref:Myosin_tail_1 domain-containing protein n=1 Tax=Echinostoma caproni TaxID=27848 RepID=A0A3P8H6T4_9TREM|nr:unnamed protein product [Echinostoma caproni]